MESGDLAASGMDGNYRTASVMLETKAIAFAKRIDRAEGPKTGDQSAEDALCFGAARLPGKSVCPQPHCHRQSGTTMTV
jgi:hypothetical protein